MTKPPAPHIRAVPFSPRRRALVASAAVLPLVSMRVVAQEGGDIPAYRAFAAGREVRMGRMRLDIPRIADNGNVIPLKVSMAGPFLPGAEVRSIHVFSEKNPVPQIAAFHFPTPTARPEIESRMRLSGTQRVAAVATLADGTLHGVIVDVTVTLSACIDGT